MIMTVTLPVISTQETISSPSFVARALITISATLAVDEKSSPVGDPRCAFVCSFECCLPWPSLGSRSSEGKQRKTKTEASADRRAVKNRLQIETTRANSHLCCSLNDPRFLSTDQNTLAMPSATNGDGPFEDVPCGGVQFLETVVIYYGDSTEDAAVIGLAQADGNCSTVKAFVASAVKYGCGDSDRSIRLLDLESLEEEEDLEAGGGESGTTDDGTTTDDDDPTGNEGGDVLGASAALAAVKAGLAYALRNASEDNRNEAQEELKRRAAAPCPSGSQGAGGAARNGAGGMVRNAQAARYVSNHWEFADMSAQCHYMHS